MHAHQVQPSEFLTNLGPTEFVAVNAAGHVVSRASSRAAVEHATKNLGEPVHIFSAADLNPPAPEPMPTSAVLIASAAEISAAIDDAPADEPEKAAPAPKKPALKK